MKNLILFSALSIISLPSFAIRNGQTTNYQEFPNAVKFSIDRSSCSGVRISKNYILSVAHCFDTHKNIRVVYHENGITYTQKVSPRKIIILDTKLDKELAIVPIFTEDHQQHFIPDEIFPFIPGMIQKGDLFSIVGFGMNSRGSFGRFLKGQLEFDQEYIINDKMESIMLEFKPTETNQNPCPGDSGSPIYNEQNKLVGVVSFVAHSKDNLRDSSSDVKVCNKADRAVYIPLNSHLEFLEDYL